jgi:hypothetical protein
MELQAFIKQELGLNGTPQENITKLLAKREEIRKVNDQIDLLLKDAERYISVYFKNILLEKHTNYQYIERTESQWGVDIAGLIIPIENTQLRVYVALEIQAKKLYCQIDTSIESQKTVDGKFPDLPAIVYEKTRKILPQKYKDDNHQIWKYFDRYDYNGVFECLKEVLSVLTK